MKRTRLTDKEFFYLQREADAIKNNIEEHEEATRILVGELINRADGLSFQELPNSIQKKMIDFYIKSCVEHEDIIAVCKIERIKNYINEIRYKVYYIIAYDKDTIYSHEKIISAYY